MAALARQMTSFVQGGDHSNANVQTCNPPKTIHKTQTPEIVKAPVTSVAEDDTWEPDPDLSKAKGVAVHSQSAADDDDDIDLT